MRGTRSARLIILAVAAIYSYECVVAWREAQAPNAITAAYTALSGFAGSYAPMPGQPDSPSPRMALGLALALLTTFGAALALVSATLRREFARIRLARANKDILVIGSSDEADMIARSHDNKKSLARIHELGDHGDANTVILDGGRPLSANKLASNLARRADRIIVAASTDTTSARLAEEVRGLSSSAKPFILIRSREMMVAIRPGTLDRLPGSEIFHAEDNVAQIVSECVARQAPSSGSLRVHLHGDTSIGAVAVAEWCRNAQASNALIFDRQRWDFTDDMRASDLTVIAGNPEWVAASAAQAPGSSPVIAVVPDDLLRALPLPTHRSIMPWRTWAATSEPIEPGKILTVDPQRDGLNVQVVTDGLASQWGRAFNDAYGYLYASHSPHREGGPSGLWDATSREGQSSTAAAIFMLNNLRHHDYQLRKGPAGWKGQRPNASQIDHMARAEHENWRKERKWRSDDGTTHHAPIKLDDDRKNEIPNVNDVDFDDLDEMTRKYNHDVISKVYPALAAMFGYGIHPATSP